MFPRGAKLKSGVFSHPQTPSFSLRDTPANGERHGPPRSCPIHFPFFTHLLPTRDFQGVSQTNPQFQGNKEIGEVARADSDGGRLRADGYRKEGEELQLRVNISSSLVNLSSYHY